MTDLEKRVRAHLNKDPGVKKKHQQELEVDIKKEANKLAREIEKAQGELPFSFGVNISRVYLDVGTDGKAKISCDINFDHEDALRDSFSPNNWGGLGDKADLIVLFEQGWSYDKPAPYGEWHGHITRALSHREGLHFIKRAVENYLASAPKNVEVDISSIYE